MIRNIDDFAARKHHILCKIHMKLFAEITAAEILDKFVPACHNANQHIYGVLLCRDFYRFTAFDGVPRIRFRCCFRADGAYIRIKSAVAVKQIVRKQISAKNHRPRKSDAKHERQQKSENLHMRPLLSASGRATITIVPLPSSLLMSIVALCFFAITAQSERPSPAPPALRDRALSTM